MLIVLITGFGVIYTLAVIILAHKIANCLGVIDHPGGQGHKKHTRPTPLVGGLAAIPPSMVALAYTFSANHISEEHAAAVIALFIAGFGSMLVGFFDDRRHIPALNRLLICACIFLLAVEISPNFLITEVSIQGLAFNSELGYLSLPFTVICLLAFQNSVNMADGKNGLVPGLTLIWIFNLFSFDLGVLNIPLLTLMICVTIVAIANISGRIFLGDAGTYGLGSIIGLTTIWVHRQGVGLHTAAVVAMFFFPIFDMIRLLVLRTLNGRHPFSADNKHLHHYLDATIGWVWGRRIYFAGVTLPILVSHVRSFHPLTGFFLAAALYTFIIFFCFLKRRPGFLEPIR